MTTGTTTVRDLLVALAVVGAYVGLLLVVALWAERAEKRGRNVSRNALVYSLSQAVYCTTWTYYGSVGLAATGGLLFLTVYLGPTLVAVFWWPLLRRLVALKEQHGLTGLPDLLSLRYCRSQGIAQLATVLTVAGLVPYLALQLKVLIATTGLVAGSDPSWAYPAIGKSAGPWIVGLMLLFTILFGIRRVRPTERHPGMMTALAVECAVKLVAFVAAGGFITYVMFDGFGDLFGRALAARTGPSDLAGGVGPTSWVAHTLVSAAAVLVLPRQFHVAVVENSDERHVRTAMWAFPAYLLVINLFVVPIALAGPLLGHPIGEADQYVLHIPYEAGHRLLAWFVFVGGFSAGTGMIVVETMALSTAISNHLLLPLFGAFRRLHPLRRHLLLTRWAAAAAVILAAFAFERGFGHRYELATMGFVSFAAVLQLAPALIAGLLSRTVSKAGALAGLAAGFATWIYTMVIPALARAGIVAQSLLTEGPWDVSALRPEALFGVGDLDPVTHCVLWSLLLNGVGLVVGSILAPAGAEEYRRVARLLRAETAPSPALPLPDAPEIATVEEKQRRLVAMFAHYHSGTAPEALAAACLARIGASHGSGLTALQLAQLEAEAETALAASIGTAAAHAAVKAEQLVSTQEARDVSSAYAALLAELRVPPAELRKKIDYHRERERLLAREAAMERFLAQVSEKLAASLDVEATGKTVVHLPVPHLAEAALLWVRPGAGPARLWFARANGAGQEPETTALDCVAGSLGAVPCIAHALRSGRPFPAQGSAGAENPWPEPLRQLDTYPVNVTVPLIARRRTVGALSLFMGAESALQLPDDLVVAEELGHRAALALENATLFHSAQEAIRARDEFLAIASHELKTPLTPLRLSIQAVKRAVIRGDLANIPPERLHDLLSRADVQIHRLGSLVDDLLDATRIGTKRLRLERRPMELVSMAREVIERHAEEARLAECEIALHAAREIHGEWDRVRLEQVFTNLLTNALKYAPRAPIDVTISSHGASARISITDHGRGIASEDLERVFRPFERAVSYMNVSGFGLGLYIAREITEAHAGTLTLSSAPGEGCTFHIELPLRSASA
ncbi:MAG TPA: ATP-binding protein [Anaeromyxobacteraceae bacterium]|nr:ATP-binding protein [Anaeromyxobacteraceae bacterium]